MSWNGPLLSIHNVTKRYGSLTAVNDLSLQIEPGEIVALLGPNGAGKTTLIGCITGLVAAFDGQIKVAGLDVVKDYRATRRLVGLVPQELNYDGFFNVHDVLLFQGGYFGLRRSAARARAAELLKSFALEDKVKANTRWLSGGMKRRLLICKALMHDPVLLFLDEPTAGVDVELREELWDYVRMLRDRGTTIVLTTHYLEEAEQLADRIGIIYKGQLQSVQPREQLMSSYGKRTLDVRLNQPVPAALVGQGPWSINPQDPALLHLDYHEGDGALPKLLAALAAHGLSPISIDGRRSSLEEIFRQIIDQAAHPQSSQPEHAKEPLR